MSQDEKTGWWMVSAFFVVLIAAVVFCVRSCGTPSDPYKGAAPGDRININGNQRKELSDMDKN